MRVTKEVTLWKDWFGTETTDSLHALIEHYQDWLVILARKFYVKYYISSYEIGDYLHWATVGLIESIKRYKQIEGAQFQTYAFKRIKGEILNQINKATENIAQYHFQKKINQQERVESLIKQSESENSFEKLCEVTVGIMIGNLLESEVDAFTQEDSLLNDVYGQQLTTNLSSYLNKLADKEKTVLMYHYFYQFRFSAISDIMQLTKGRVSQLHNNALSKLREMIRPTEFEVYL